MDWPMVILCAIFSINLWRQYEAEPVKSLPGIPSLGDTKMFSGFLNGRKPSHQLFYIFVQSERDPEDDPVIIWMNGGPGCSSFIAFFGENGPFLLNKLDNTFTKNEYRWNKAANVLFIDSPPMTGFSHINGSSTKDDYKTSDKLAVEEVFQGIESFFEIFPNLKDNRKFIAGESYGGFIVPALIKRSINTNVQPEGFMLVSPALEYKHVCVSRVFYWYFHGMISEEKFTNYTDVFCNGKQTMKACHIEHPMKCLKETDPLKFGTGNINIYNIYYACTFDPKNPPKMDVPLEHRCGHSYSREEYLNRLDVQKALHAQQFRTKPHNVWKLCNNELEQELYTAQIESSVENLKSILAHGIRGVIFSGDLDSLTPLYSVETVFDIVTEGKFEDQRSYFTYRGSVAGYTKASKDLRHFIIKQSGHMTLADQPELVMKMLNRFLDTNQESQNYLKF